MVESATDIQPDIRGRVARVTVRWELRAGERVETGTDYFTFVRRPDGWRIVNLVFEAD